MRGYSLVEEGEQVPHHHQCRSGDAQEDLPDALSAFVKVLYSCREKYARPGDDESLRRHHESVTQVRHPGDNSPCCGGTSPQRGSKGETGIVGWYDGTH